jgi:hypothetical protein
MKNKAIASARQQILRPIGRITELPSMKSNPAIDGIGKFAIGVIDFW